MAPKIFLTGVTGYIGGDLLAELYPHHPEYDYSLLVRTQAGADKVQASFPAAKNLRFVLGTLDDTDLLAREAAAADVVIHTANSADEAPSTTALTGGVAEGHSAAKPGVYIHISGSGVLIWKDIQEARFGQPLLPDQVYDDLDHVDRVLHDLPDDALHRDVDKIVLGAAAAHPAAVRAAIVSPPTIYGASRSTGNTRSVQAPAMATYMLQRGYAPIIEGPGDCVWDNVHVADLSKLLVRLVEAGLNPAERDSSAVFGDKVYYFAANEQPHRWSDLARWLAAAAVQQGHLPAAGDNVKKVGIDVVMAPDAPGIPLINASWGTNSRGGALRARQLLGWSSQGPSLQDEVASLVADEARRLGLQPAHK